MADEPLREIIAVRSLTETDLGLFASQRARLRSHQRAININVPVARAILTGDQLASGKASFRCICTIGDERVDSVRRLWRTGKNWRLGGDVIVEPAFAALDSKDFMLIRTVEGNDGSHPLHIFFFSRNNDLIMQIGIAGMVERSLGQSMALFREGEDAFAHLAQHCPIY